MVAAKFRIYFARWSDFGNSGPHILAAQSRLPIHVDSDYADTASLMVGSVTWPPEVEREVWQGSQLQNPREQPWYLMVILVRTANYMLPVTTYRCYLQPLTYHKHLLPPNTTTYYHLQKTSTYTYCHLLAHTTAQQQTTHSYSDDDDYYYYYCCYYYFFYYSCYCCCYGYSYGYGYGCCCCCYNNNYYTASVTPTMTRRRQQLLLPRICRQ